MEDTFKYSYNDIQYDPKTARLTVKEGPSFRIIIKQGDQERELSSFSDKNLVQSVVQDIHNLFDQSQLKFDTLDNLTINSKGIQSEKKIQKTEIDSELIEKITNSASLVFLQEISPPKEPPKSKKMNTKTKEETTNEGIKIRDHTVPFTHKKPDKFTNSKEIRIQNSLGKATTPTNPMNYSQAEISDQDFNTLLKSNYRSGEAPKTDLGFFDFSDENGTYIDFANGTFGSAYLDATAQEEIMVLEHPDVAFLIEEEKQNGNTIYTIDKKGNPTPVLVEKVHRKHEYNKSKNNVKDVTIPRITNFLGMAAENNQGKSGPYTEKSIKYHLKTAYVAFMLAKAKNSNTTIHTGLWGCGVFGNNPNMMLTIQAIAASMAGVPVVFHGIDNYDLPKLEGESIDAVVQELVTLSANDANWQISKRK